MWYQEVSRGIAASFPKVFLSWRLFKHAQYRKYCWTTSLPKPIKRKAFKHTSKPFKRKSIETHFQNLKFLATREGGVAVPTFRNSDFVGILSHQKSFFFSQKVGTALKIRFDTSGTLIALIVSEISPSRFFVVRSACTDRGGIVKSCSWVCLDRVPVWLPKAKGSGLSGKFM